MSSILAAIDQSLYVPAWVTFFIVMSIVGFVLVLIDKKRFDLQNARSNQMMAPRKKKADAEESSEEQPEEGGKGKKGKGKKRKDEVPEDYEYQDRIPNGAFIAIAVFFGAVGELLAMLIFRHKWYKWSMRTFVPILTLINLALFGLILYVIIESGTGGILTSG